MPEPLRVLLFGAIRGQDPLSGDVAYVETLLQDPPPGVVYTTYRDALEQGLVRIRGRRRSRVAHSLTEDALFGLSVAEHVARTRGLMFREVVHHVEIQPGAFDLIHQHLIPVHQVGQPIPVVSSAGYPEVLSSLVRRSATAA